jgi:phage-related protein
MVVAAFVLLGVVLGKAAVESATVREALAKMASVVMGAFQSFAKMFTAQVVPALQGLWETIQEHLLPVLAKVLPVLEPVAKFILKVLGQAVIGAIKGVIQFLEGLVKVVAGVFNLVAAIVKGDWSKAWQAVKDIVGGTIDAVVGALKVWLNVGILAIFRGGIKALLDLWRGAWTTVRTTASSAFKAVDDLVASVWRSIMVRSGRRGTTCSVRSCKPSSTSSPTRYGQRSTATTRSCRPCGALCGR